MMPFARKNQGKEIEKTAFSSSFSSCLLDKNVKASVVDVDYDMGIVGMTADYIISVSPKSTSSPTTSFDPFKISKTYKSFRKLAKTMVQTVETAANRPEANIIKFATSIENLIDSQDREYLLRTRNKDDTKELSLQRSKILNDALQSICNNDCSFKSCSTGEEILKILEEFFLTDQVGENRSKKKLLSDFPWPLTQFKRRRSIDGYTRENIEISPSFEGESKTDDIDKESEQKRVFRSEIEQQVKQQERNIFPFSKTTSSFLVGVSLLATIVGLRSASTVAITVTLGLDKILLICLSLFCMGLLSSSLLLPSSPKPSEQQQPQIPLTGGNSKIHHPSLLVEEIDEEDMVLKSPLTMFPADAKLGDHLNCWSIPDSINFKVRGPGYLKDKKKNPSAPFLLPVRGMDLMLTDNAPENIGKNSAILGGTLREKPTFVINFRLPWGVVILYFEIPEKFVPFVKSGYEPGYKTGADMSKTLESMSPGEQCMAKFLQADEVTKDKVLKIVPVVVQGPWVVRGVVNGKPAIVGKALPVTYLYEKAEEGKALYLEADMDVVSSAAARNILSVVRGHTKSLTMDLGFVVQGNSEDELPEQMLGAVRCHGIDIYSCSPLPPMKTELRLVASEDSNDSGDS